MTVRNITEKLKTVLSLALALLQVALSYGMLLMENGAIFYRLPITAFIQRGYEPKAVPTRRLDELQLWNCFSYYPAVSTWDIIQGTSGKYRGKDKTWHHGKYLFTVDWAHPESNILDTLNIRKYRTNISALTYLALDDGNYAAQPNNRLIWDHTFFYCERKYS
jgi:hypothetical protein